MKLIGYEPSLNGRLSNESVNMSPALRPKRPIASGSPCDAVPNVVRTVHALVTSITVAAVLRCWISAPTLSGGGSKDWHGGSVALG